MPRPRKALTVTVNDCSSNEEECFVVDLEASDSRRGQKRKAASTTSEHRRGGGRGRRAAFAGKTATRKVAAKGRGRGKPTNASKHVNDLETSVDVLILGSDDCDLVCHGASGSDGSNDSCKENIEDNVNSNTVPPQSNTHNSDLDEDDEDKETVTALIGFDPTVTFSDSDSDDIYSVNHNAIKASAQEEAQKGLIEEHKLQEKLQLDHQMRIQQSFHQQSPNSQRHSTRHRSRYDGIECSGSDGDDRISSDDAISSSPEISSIKLSASKLVKVNKKTQMALAKAKRMAMSIEKDFMQDLSILNASDGDLQLLDEQDTNPVILMKVKYGVTFTKIPIKKSDKFGVAYQQLAEQHGVSFDNVVLNLRDDILSPDQTPADVALTIADIVVCGIIRKCPSTTTSTVAETPSDPNTLQVKLQCSSRRGILYINVNKFEKMMAVMQRYADKKEEPLEKLKFMFDGEKLDPNDTPLTLDLEGGECIDVFPV